jgi:hypothetical protein
MPLKHGINRGPFGARGIRASADAGNVGPFNTEGSHTVIELGGRKREKHFQGGHFGPLLGLQF